MSEEKKSWFNRIWSAMTGLIVGVAAMFGVNHQQVTGIKNDVKGAYDKVQEVQVAIENKDLVGAITAVTDAANALKEIVGEVNDTKETVVESFESYKAQVAEIKAAIDAKDWKASHDKAVDFAAALTAKVPADQLTGSAKTAYDLTSKFITDVDEGKYDGAIAFAEKIMALFNKTAAPEVPSIPETPAAPAAETPAN